MTRLELLNFAVDVSRDEYVRGQGRLALVETKAQLIAVTAGVFITVLVTYGVDKLPLNSPGTGLLAVFAILSLAVALVYSLTASIFVEVNPPPSATDINKLVLAQIGDSGSNTTPDPKESEQLVREQASAYALAATNLADATKARIGKLKVAQLALLVAFLFIVVWLGLPAMAAAIAQFNSAP